MLTIVLRHFLYRRYEKKNNYNRLTINENSYNKVAKLFLHINFFNLFVLIVSLRNFPHKQCETSIKRTL